MQPIENFDSATLAKTMLRRRREGALATLMTDSGDPYCSLVALASQHDGSPILLISDLALHTQNILSDSRVSLMLDERGPRDPLQGSRIMISGHAEKATGETAEILRKRYLAAHPSAQTFENFKDFSFFGIRIAKIHLVAGFGRIVDLTPAQVLTDLTGAEALIAAEADICEHMNADHRDAMELFATHLLGAENADWRCSGCDPEGIDMQAGTETLRLDVGQRATNPGEMAKSLKLLADKARIIAN